MNRSVRGVRVTVVDPESYSRACACVLLEAFGRRLMSAAIQPRPLSSKPRPLASLQVTRIVDYILSCVYRSDLAALQSFWIHVNQRFFSHLSHDSANTAYKLEANILKLFLVQASKTGRQDEIRMFFERMCDSLHERKEWKDWFGGLRVWAWHSE